MQLNHLKALVAIVDTGGFNSAAAKLGLTQAAVSMQIKRLEEWLGFELFERSVRPPRLNNAGLELLDQAREIVELCERFRDSAPGSSRLRGTIKIGAVTGLSHFIPQTLSDLRAKYRHLQVQIVSGFAGDLAHAVVRGRLEAAVITQFPELDPDLNSRPIFSDSMVVVAPRSYAGQSDTEILSNNPYVGPNRNTEVGRLIENSLSKRKINSDQIMEFDTVETLLMMVLHGLAVGINPRTTIGDRYLDDVYLAPFDAPPIQRTVSLIQRRESRRPQFLDALYDSLCQVVVHDSSKVQTASH
tara:strand:- start:15186 stop:16085 length:900 start_codon:yes stop_codon:yes gene_type:complete